MVEGTKEAFGRHWVRWLTLGGSVGFLTLVGPSCMYDKNNPCGDDLVVKKDADGNERCVCPPQTIYSPTGCIECGPNQIVQGTACVCDEGYTMGANGTCEEIAGSGGSTSTGTTGPNTSSTGSSGAAGEGGEDTTTTSTTGSAPECTVNDDCAPAEICAAGVCRPPTGWGSPCSTNDECAGFEAAFCDTFQMGCTVSNCSNVPDTCPAGFDCCDLSATPGFAIMCIPTGPYCPTPAP
ncbi:MAG TPA: hypothetical protein VI197_30285 [Polyangiaceae bacterium]